MKIFKYVLDPEVEYHEIELSIGAKVLSAQNQNGKLCVWAAVHPGLMVEIKRFRVHLTEHTIKDDGRIWRFVDTVQIDDMVYHVFKENDDAENV